MPTDGSRGPDRDSRMPRKTARLPRRLADRLENAVEQGHYPNESEAIRDGLEAVLPPARSLDAEEVAHGD